jgi:hypothetical protein
MRQHSARWLPRMVENAEWPEVPCGRNLSDDSSRATKFVSRLLKDIERRARELFQDQHVIRVIGRDGEDGNSVRRERLNERQQYSCLRERKRSLEFEADPAMWGLNVCGKIFSCADDGKFVRGTRDRCESALLGPIGNRRVGCEAHDGVVTGKAAKLELLPHLLTRHRLPHRRPRQQSGGIERWQRRCFRRDQQRNFCATQHDRVAALIFHGADDFDVVGQ